MRCWRAFMFASRRFAVAATLVSSLILGGCDINRVERTENFEASYELLKVNPPKHFYIDVRNTDTNEVYKNKYVSKRCNNYRENAIVGKIYKLTATRRYFTDGTSDVRFTPARKIFCGY